MEKTSDAVAGEDSIVSGVTKQHPEHERMRSTEIAQRLATRAADVASFLFPNGKRDGNEWRVGSLDGEAGQSLAIHLTGDKAGIWADFSDDSLKGDLFGLWKRARGLEDADAAADALSWLGVSGTPQITAATPTRINVPVRIDKPPVIVHPRLGKPSAVWAYGNAAGEIIGFECRFDTIDGKIFSPFTHAGDGWQWKGFSKPLPLYLMPALAAHPEKQVIVCEGCKAASAAAALFMHAIVTTWPGGANQAKHANWSVLRGRNVVLWPDADEPGIKAMADVAAAIGTTCKIFDVSDRSGGWDAADFTAADGHAIRWAKDHVRAIESMTPIPISTPAPVLPETPQIAAQEVEEVHTFLTENYLAGRFCELHPGMRYVDVWGKWMEWDGKRWAQEDTRRALDLARAVCIQHLDGANLNETDVKKVESARFRAAVENIAREDRRAAAKVDQWDNDLWSLNTPAGVVDLRTGSIRAALPNDYCTKITAVAPVSGCPQWLEFLRTVCDFDDELVSFLQRVIGYSLTGDTREQVLFFFYGTGANGKGTFINTLTRIFGQYATTAGMDVLAESKHERHPQELARLRGARMVCAQETEQGRRWAEARIKALTGGDIITARFMRQDDFEFVPQFKLMVAGNHKPGLRNVDEAMRRRLHLIPFTVTIPPEKRDKLLGAKLWGEAPGILQWAIDGCVAWQRDGLQPPTCVRKATEDYLNSQDQFLLWLDECTERVSGREGTGPLYRSFKAWAEGRGEHACAQGRFNEMLEYRGFNISKIHGLPMATGLALRSQQQDVENIRNF